MKIPSKQLIDQLYILHKNFILDKKTSKDKALYFDCRLFGRGLQRHRHKIKNLVNEILLGNKALRK